MVQLHILFVFSFQPVLLYSRFFKEYLVDNKI
jgi:hypothetical protein